MLMPRLENKSDRMKERERDREKKLAKVWTIMLARFFLGRTWFMFMGDDDDGEER